MNNSEILKHAETAREKAYAPYSLFKVGAVLLTKDARMFDGCNVENASYSLCNCAERTAFFSAIAAGYKPGDFAKLAVIADTETPITPCGACRQVILELGGEKLIVVLGNLQGDQLETSSSDLLPGAFSKKDLNFSR